MADYIDREAVKRALAASDVVPKSKADNRPVTDKIIDDISAADVAPVVHGRWIEQRHTFDPLSGGGTCTGTYPTCCLCGAFETGFHQRTEYCPGCGAKMDGGDENAGSCGL